MTAPSLVAPGGFVRILLAETRAEVLKLVRLPGVVVPMIAFPALFYAVFGLVFGARPIPGAPVSVAGYMIATYGTFGVVSAGLFGLGVGVAVERGQGWLTVKRASPMPPSAYFAAKVAMAMVFSALVVLVLVALGAGLGHVRLPLASWGALLGTLVAGAAPFCALGCAIAYLTGPNSAPAAANLVNLPMALGSGLWIPIEVLPRAVRAVAPFLPPYHLSRLALHAIGVDHSPVLGHAAALVLFTAAFLALAIFGYRRDDGKAYG